MTGHGEPVEPCAGYSFGNVNYAQLFMTLCIAIMALTGTLVHMVMGNFSHGVHQTIALAIGVVLGAQPGAYLSNRIKGTRIIRSLAIAFEFIAIRILMILKYKIIDNTL